MRKLVAFAVISLLLAGAEIGGRVKAFSSLFLSQNLKGPYFSHKSGEFFVKRMEVRLKIQGEVSEKISYGVRFDAFAGPDAYFLPFPESGPLGSPASSEPFELNLYEAYMKVSDFLLENLDLTVGKQRISWGTADKVNVVDNLNPLDFANFLTFDPDYFAERRPQLALNLEYYAGENTKLQAVFLPEKQYSPLPYGFSSLLTPSYSIYMTAPEITINRKENTLENSNFGLRFSTVVLNTDVGLSWYHGNFHLPVFAGFSYINPTMEAQPFAVPELKFSYPDLNVLGVDLSGELFSVGFWAEFAYYMPEKVEGEMRVGMGPSVPFRIFEDGYLKYVLGFDYTLGIGNGLYINAQFIHGLFDERDYTGEAEKIFNIRKGQFFGEIENYIMARAEYKLASDTVKLSLGTLVEMGDKTAYAIMPGVEFRLKDALSVQTGLFLVSGDQQTKFGAFKEDKMGFVSVKLDF